MNIKLRNIQKNYCFIINLKNKTFEKEGDKLSRKNIHYPTNVIFFDDVCQALLCIGRLKPKTIIANLDSKSESNIRIIELLNEQSNKDGFNLIITNSIDDYFVFIN